MNTNQDAIQDPKMTLDVGLDDDLLAAFNGGARQELILLVQIVRLLRKLPSDTPKAS